jgi:hypothetical protein
MKNLDVELTTSFQVTRLSSPTEPSGSHQTRPYESSRVLNTKQFVERKMKSEDVNGEFCLLGYNAVHSLERQLTFRRNIIFIFRIV